MQTESVTPTTTKPKAGKPKTNEERLAPLTAAVATATRERDELAQLVERDRARLAKARSTSTERPTDENVDAEIHAEKTLAIRERALAQRQAQLDAAGQALFVEQRAILHEDLVAKYPLAFAETFKAAAATHLAALQAAFANVEAELAALENLAADSSSHRAAVEPATKEHGYPNNSGGSSQALASVLRETVIARGKQLLANRPVTDVFPAPRGFYG